MSFLVSTVGGMDLRDRDGDTWTLLTGHGRVLVEIARNSKARVRDITAAAGLAGRTVQAIIADLEAAGYPSRSRPTAALSMPSTHPPVPASRPGRVARWPGPRVAGIARRPAGAAFGVLVAVFQYGWGLHLLNLGQAGPVESFLPVLMLAVLFGLSTDYEVSLVSRIREEWAASGDNRQAVHTGQATTGRVIIAAATVMICVFSAFILSGQQITGEFGLGLAGAVLLDAFLLRTLLVPALMHLSGRANWWLPGGLDRSLPHLSIEPATQPPAQPRDRQRPHPQHAVR